MPVSILGYPSKRTLTEAIRNELKKYPLNVEFESPLLQRVISELHYFCAPNKIIPVRFKKTLHPKYGKAYYFMGLFPNIGWHGVSWTKCVNGWTLDNEIKASLRRSVDPIIDAYRKSHAICERCGQRSAFEVDHVDPEFDTIATEAMRTLTVADRDKLLRDFSWIDEETFTLPNDMKCVRVVVKSHETTKLMALCHDCHVVNARDRHCQQRAARFAERIVK